MRVSKTREGPITAVLRIRGQDKDTLELLCEGWEQAIRKVRRWLPYFEQRNPWLYCDSRQHKLYILLDPETEAFAGARYPKRTPAPVQTMTKKGDHR